MSALSSSTILVFAASCGASTRSPLASLSALILPEKCAAVLFLMTSSCAQKHSLTCYSHCCQSQCLLHLIIICPTRIHATWLKPAHMAPFINLGRGHWSLNPNLSHHTFHPSVPGLQNCQLTLHRSSPSFPFTACCGSSQSNLPSTKILTLPIRTKQEHCSAPSRSQAVPHTSPCNARPRTTRQTT